MKVYVALYLCVDYEHIHGIFDSYDKAIDYTESQPKDIVGFYDIYEWELNNPEYSKLMESE